MARIKTWCFPSILSSALILFAAFPGGSLGADFATEWTISYTDLKADLRVLAGDPLNPRRFYLGTDQKILATDDGGRTWVDLQSFRDDKIDLTGLPSEKALRHIAMLETPEETAARARAEQEEGEKEKISALPVSAAEAEAAASAAQAKLQDLEVRLRQAEEEARKFQAELMRAQSELGDWEMDELTISEVDAIEEGGEFSSDWIEEPYYTELADWLEDRGLSVVESGPERKRTLIDYLQKHEAEGLALTAAASAAETAFDVAQTQYDTLEAQTEQARMEREQAATAAASAARAQAAAEVSSRSSGRAPAPIEEATPAQPDEYISGVTYIVVDPSRPERVIASTFDGIFVSLDRGKSWSLTYRGTGAGQSAIVCLAIDPSSPAIIFAGSLSGLVRSDDGGMSWTRVEGIIADKVIISLLVHPSDSRIVFAGTEGDGLFKSIDGGRTWRQVFVHSTTGGNSIRAIAVSPARPDFVWLGTAAGVFTSADRGWRWRKTLSLGLSDDLVRHLAASPAEGKTAYVATSSGVFATADSGRSFCRVTFGLYFRGCNFLAFEPGNAKALWLVTDQRVCRSGPRTRPRPLGDATCTQGASLRPKR